MDPRYDQMNGDKGAWVIQEYAPNTEGVVFYYKLPYMSKGYIKNIGIREESEKIPGKKNTPLTAQYWPETFRTDFMQNILNSSMIWRPKFPDTLEADSISCCQHLILQN